MAQTEARPSPEPRALQELLDAISTGAVDDLDELDPGQLDLLRQLLGDGETLQALLDRLAGPDREA
jgi:hypothetical protein